METSKLVKAALIIALALALQSIRLVIPLPPMVGAFLIGSFVHTMLVIARRYSGMQVAAFLACVLPCTAYLQGQLALVILVPIVVVGNLIFVYLVGRFTKGWQEYAIPALSKAVFMSGAFAGCAMGLLHLDMPAVFFPVLFAMSVPQLVTGIIGIYVGKILLSRLKVLKNT